jgi:hypothetical protein
VSSEHEEQKGLIIWFRLKYPNTLIFSIPNGGYRDISTAKKLKAEGVTKGVPDLYIPKIHCWVEMKTVDGGKLSEEQIEIHHYLRMIGDEVIVGFGATDASIQILNVMKKHNIY